MNTSTSAFRFRPLAHESHKAFTLVELLTVVAIIGILAGILIPVVGSIQSKAKNTACVANLRNIGGLFSLYQQENNNFLPAPARQDVEGDNWHMWDDDVLMSYIGKGNFEMQDPGNMEEGTVFECPSAHAHVEDLGLAYNASNSGYGMNKSLPSNRNSQSKFTHREPRSPYRVLDLSRAALVMDSLKSIVSVSDLSPVLDAAERHGGHVNVLFMDYHVESIVAEDIPTSTDTLEGEHFWEGAFSRK